MKSPIEAPSEHAQLLGWWQLVSSEVEFQVSGRREPMYGAPAQGFLVFDATGRMMTVIEVLEHGCTARERDRQDAERGLAYTGCYRVEGNAWRTEVDAASLTGWTGSVQERSFLIESGRLYVCSAWCVSPLHGGEIVRARLVWKRPEETSGE